MQLPTLYAPSAAGLGTAAAAAPPLVTLAILAAAASAAAAFLAASSRISCSEARAAAKNSASRFLRASPSLHRLHSWPPSLGYQLFSPGRWRLQVMHTRRARMQGLQGQRGG